MNLQERFAAFSPKALQYAAYEIQANAEWGDLLSAQEADEFSDEQLLALEVEVEILLSEVADLLGELALARSQSAL